MKKYEYKCISIWGGKEKITQVLNEYGLMGWEFVFVIGSRHYFKRTIE